MRITHHDSFLSCTTSLSVLVFCFSGFAIGQAPSTRKAEIVNLNANAYVSVEFEVRAADKQLVIPVCRETEANGRSLCMANLQRIIGGKWKNATPRKETGAVLGFESKEYWKPLVIAPGDHASFPFEFSKEFFGNQKGEHLRIMLEAWDTVESMASKDESDNQLATPVFECP